MAFPESYKSKIVPALRAFLEAETASAAEPSLNGDIEFDYNSNIHLPSQNPKGLVYMVSGTPTVFLDGRPLPEVCKRTPAFWLAYTERLSDGAGRYANETSEIEPP